MTMFSDGMLLGVGVAALATFIGISPIYETAGVKPWPAGTQAGDLAILVSSGGASTATGFTDIAGDSIPGGTTGFAYRVLSSGDISSPPSISAPGGITGFYIVIWRGPTVAAKKTTASSSGSSVVVAGFTKAGNSKVVMGVSLDREDSGTIPGTPSGFTSRANGRSTYYAFGIYDILSSAYGGGSVTLPLISGGFGGVGTLLELT